MMLSGKARGAFLILTHELSLRQFSSNWRPPQASPLAATAQTHGWYEPGSRHRSRHRSQYTQFRGARPKRQPLSSSQKVLDCMTFTRQPGGLLTVPHESFIAHSAIAKCWIRFQAAHA